MEGTRDHVVWALSSSGRLLAIHLGGQLLRGTISDRWKLMWDLPMPLKVNCFG